MAYTFQFGVVLDSLPELLDGAVRTMELSAVGMALGLAIGTAGALGRTLGGRAVRLGVRAYVEAIRNTPFLVQLFIVYFSLPALGLRVQADQAAALGMGINAGAYLTEILRGGIEAVPRGQVEAGRALGLNRLQVFRLIMLLPALRIAYPALSSQFILLMLGSSVVSTISAEELTAVTNTLQSTTFRAFEFYFASTALYLAMALLLRLLLDGGAWLLWGRRAR